MRLPDPFFDYDYNEQIEVYIEAKEPSTSCNEFFIVTTSYFYRSHIREYLVGVACLKSDHFITVLILDQDTEHLCFNILPLEVHISYRQYNGVPDVHEVDRETSDSNQRIMDFRNFIDDLRFIDD